MKCFYKKTFLRELASLPPNYRERVEKLVFEKIPKTNNDLSVLDIKKMSGYKNYYRIRVGKYRVGCKVENSNKITFYRVKLRSNIYKIFP